MQNKLIVILISLFSFGFTATGQKLINSPFSRFNIGSLQTEGSFKSLGMGGVGIAMRDNASLYFANPASYSSLDTNSFIFDFGIDYGKNIISGNTSKFSSKDINFHHLIMGFPVSKGWGVALGIVPVSSGYYELLSEVTSTDALYDPSIGTYAIDHTGDGGITKFFVGTGRKINKNFSIGINMSFLSGQLTRRNQFIFADYTTVFNNRSDETLELHGLNFEYGLQYMAALKNDYFFNAGISLTTAHKYKSKYNQLSERFSAFGVVDTISFTSDNHARTLIPNVLRLGFAFGKKNKFTTGLDYITSKWSASEIPGSTNYAADTKTLLFGAEYIPERFSNYSLINRLEYRLGAHYGDNYLIINKKQIKEYGVSAGIGFPIKRTASVANIYFDFTRRTGPASSSIQGEDVFSVGLSMNLYDFWFVKRKYD